MSTHKHEHKHDHSSSDSHNHNHNHSHGHIHSHNAQGNILTAFVLNLVFVIIEIAGGFFTNSVAILSDAIHDMGDCIAIGCAWGLEKLSHKRPDNNYTYGYRRYSLLSALITAGILIGGGIVVIYTSVQRIINPEPVRSTAMIVIACFGVLINGAAVLKTSHGANLNEKSISLHMLEDVLGWCVVLIGSIVIRVSDITIIDPILSIGVSIFLMYNAFRNIISVFSVLLDKSPVDFDMDNYKQQLSGIDGVCGVHHVHVWTLDGEILLATVHVVCPSETDMSQLSNIKADVREISSEAGISHITIEAEAKCDCCECEDCTIHEQ